MSIKKINVVKSTDVTKTLLGIGVGETVSCPNSLIFSSVIRSTASRLSQNNKARFTIQSCNDGVLITRL